ncbi:hypothetical protein [Pseudomonas phage vB_Pa-PAC2]|nr:hypothetical protein Deiofobo_0309 [Pseudomonas phage Deifobo]WPK40541.1 hypothetical protein Paride_0311 [Pseudomonas phage Paride]
MHINNQLLLKVFAVNILYNSAIDILKYSVQYILHVLKFVCYLFCIND